MTMPQDDIFTPNAARSRPPFGGAQARGKVIDQDGRELADGPLHPQFQGFQQGFQEGFQFDFRNTTASPFGNLTREQRIARIEAIAKLLDVAFVLPGTNIRYGIDGLIGLIPVVGDIVTTAISLWLVREARALGAPWYITGRMLGNVALDGVVGLVPFAGDAFDVMFRANMRNVRMLRRWLDKQPRRA
ncbi:DUF4112 domain-containing protein [Bradyrhizobium sp. BEA-2-5]|uniref:DUF4112 domain-containing protein n=1 Tax=Bradyrhizobium sp. BEA-2-5 TaxID=3080015 RepID=UPI00293EBC67|nr:DUF4112 domain-containing protein [Bradyrhizobium sp. BEA-2-5]WOH80716.1 DUF4112 domain-containing protein [Bradyrhizobium sp. BEA-2-5]